MIKALLQDPEKRAETVLFAKQLARFIVGGTSSAILIYSMIYVLVEFASIHYIISNNIATAFIYLYSYMMNKVFVFKDKSKQHLKQGRSFVVMRVVLLIVANLILLMGVEIFQVHYMIVLVFVSFCDAVFSFLIMKLFVFKPEGVAN